MFTMLTIISIQLIAGSALYSFIKPVTKARYEQIIGIETLDESSKFK